MSKVCTNCGEEVTNPTQILASHEAWGKVLCFNCQIKANEGELDNNESEQAETTIDEDTTNKDDNVEAEELTQEERLKIAEMVQESGYDKETAMEIVTGKEVECKQVDAIQIPKGYIPKLSISDVKQYLCPMATDQEAYVFLELCKARQLNPFTNEVYLIKYNPKDKAQAVVGKETFTRKAEMNKNFDGFDAGVIVQNLSGDIERRAGTFYIHGETLLGGWAKVYRNDKKHEFIDEVALTEYIQVTKEGEPNKFWRSKPGTMIRKVALCHALREAFPSEFGGLYDRSELDI